MTQKIPFSEIEKLLADGERRKTERAIDFYKPLPRQSEFHAALVKERALIAGNQEGKTVAGAAEMSYHLTGLYPTWWVGKRFDKAIVAWACGVKGADLRDGPQKLLCGMPGIADALGTGFIPKDAIVGKPSMARGVTDLYDTLHVRHVSGGVSALRFKSYEEGRTGFQGASVNVIWNDEEPKDSSIYPEEIARVSATKGIIFSTFTPLLGMTDTVKLFFEGNNPQRAKITMTIWEGYHSTIMTKAEIEALIESYPSHERDARTMGIPKFGAGLIFRTDEANLRCQLPPFRDVRLDWLKAWAIDPGIGHSFGAVLMYWDREADTVYVAKCIKMKDSWPRDQAVLMKIIGAAVPVIWPQDATARSKNDGVPLHVAYRMEGLLMVNTHAQYRDQRGNSTEAAIVDLDQRMKTGRFKVDEGCVEWFNEYRQYHRKDDDSGQIVKRDDDLMSATQKGIMMLPSFRAVPLGPKAPPRNRGGQRPIADGVDSEWYD